MDLQKPTHTDHPSRHWDRTCPACVEQAEKQEPVEWVEVWDWGPKKYVLEKLNPATPLYKAPPKSKWVSLTDEEIDYLWGISKPDYEDKFQFPRAIEAKLKELNK